MLRAACTTEVRSLDQFDHHWAICRNRLAKRKQAMHGKRDQRDERHAEKSLRLIMRPRNTCKEGSTGTKSPAGHGVRYATISNQRHPHMSSVSPSAGRTHVHLLAMALLFLAVGDDRDDPCSNTPCSIRTPCSSVLGSSPYLLSGAVMSKTIVVYTWPRQV